MNTTNAVEISFLDLTPFLTVFLLCIGGQNFVVFLGVITVKKVSKRPRSCVVKKTNKQQTHEQKT